ncbi:hypothetical protein Tco_0316857 [Tanacetum coccineum]
MLGTLAIMMEERSSKSEDSKALVTNEWRSIYWTSHLPTRRRNYALMACKQLTVRHRAEAMKEKEDLKAKVEKWHNSSKNLGKLINTQMSANVKFCLGYGDHRYDGILSYENKVLQSVFKGKEIDFENPPLYDRFVTAGGMNVVPPPMTGNYMPSGPDIEIDESQFTYGPKQTQPSESETQTSEFDTCESNISSETPELVSEPVVNKSNVACQPKVWSDALIIKEYESDSEDEYVSIPTKEQEAPSFANQKVKTPRETVKNHFTHSKNPKVDKKELGYGFTARACFVCGSLNHLIRDCDFHEKMMAKQAELNNRLNRNSSQKEIRPIWNNVQRVNNQNQFVPTVDSTQVALQNKGIVLIRGCSQAHDWKQGLPLLISRLLMVALCFGGSKVYITGKECVTRRTRSFTDLNVMFCLLEFKLPEQSSLT